MFLLISHVVLENPKLSVSLSKASPLTPVSKKNSSASDTGHLLAWLSPAWAPEEALGSCITAFLEACFHLYSMDVLAAGTMSHLFCLLKILFKWQKYILEVEKISNHKLKSWKSYFYLLLSSIPLLFLEKTILLACCISFQNLPFASLLMPVKVLMFVKGLLGVRCYCWALFCACSQLIHRASLQGKCYFCSPFHKRENQGWQLLSGKARTWTRAGWLRSSALNLHCSAIGFGIWDGTDPSPLLPVCSSSSFVRLLLSSP